MTTTLMYVVDTILKDTYPITLTRWMLAIIRFSPFEKYQSNWNKE